MQFTTIALTLAAAAGLVSAAPSAPVMEVKRAALNNCTPGLNYCAAILLDKGNYQAQISEAMANVGWSGYNQYQALFHCDGGPNGAIHVAQWCSGSCHDGGSGNSDYCGGNRKAVVN